MPPAVTLHLSIQAAPGKRDELLAFLRRARSYYESPGGIRMKLLQSRDDADAFIEVFEYDTVEAYKADEQRVEHDPQMKSLLAEWRSLLAGPPRVGVFEGVSLQYTSPPCNDQSSGRGTSSPR